MSDKQLPAVKLAVGMAMIGTVGAFAVESGLSPVSVVFWRCVFGTLFLGLWCIIRGYLPDRSLSLKRLTYASLAGVCMVLSWIAFFAGFTLTSIATTTIVYHIQPFFVVLIGAVFLRELISLNQVLWMAGAFTGVILASGLIAPFSVISIHWVLGVALTLVAALLYAISTVVGKGLGQQRPEITTLCQTIVGIILLAPFTDSFRSVPPESWGWLIGIGVLHTGVAYVLMYSAYPKLTTPVIGVLTFIYPLVAIIVDWVFYGHQPGVIQMTGMMLIALCTLGVKLGWHFPVGRQQKISL
ncbi:DMT family transporter [Serratia marcescens]|uniref:DMT family transporter n=1 Tax=Serratia nevei TaxID=2703794 RepID=UPI0018D77653|nr:DMT family transporter [Serratia marcescens]HCD7747002.1 DMT family transporter [Serratia marcescens]HCD7748991.1 DMT family transporter [Serratia marcescens]